MPDFDKHLLTNLTPEKLTLLKTMIEELEKEKALKDASDGLRALVNANGVYTGAMQFLQVSCQWNLGTREKVSILCEYIKEVHPATFTQIMRHILGEVQNDVSLTRCRINALEADFDEEMRIYDHLRAKLLDMYSDNNRSMFTTWDATNNFRRDTANTWEDFVNERSYSLQKFVRQNEQEEARMRVEMDVQGIPLSQL